MNVFHDMFPRFYDLSKEGNENCEISGNQSASVLSFLQSFISAALLHLW